jgi:hypothetical protein
MDTVRRVNSNEPMTLDELYWARRILDKHSGAGTTDVHEARLRVSALIDQRTPRYAPTAGATAARASVPAEPTSSKPTKQGNPVIGFLVLAFIVGSILHACNGSDEDGGAGGSAASACEDLVADRLRAPATADFPGTSAYTITGSGDTYTVAGYVDAENGFGAFIRSDWTCTVRATGNGRFELQSLTGLD